MMFTKAEMKSQLLGVFEIFLFMRQGIDRFPSDTKSAIKSFIFLALTLPLGSWIIFHRPDDFSPEIMVLLFNTRFLIGAIVTLIFVYFLAVGFNRKREFARFITVCNWTTLINLVLLIPVIVSTLFFPGEWEPIKNYALFITLYSYVLVGYVATHSLSINWYMGGFIAIFCLLIDQRLIKLSESVFGFFI